MSGDKALGNFKKGITRTATGFAYLRNSSLVELIIGSSAQTETNTAIQAKRGEHPQFTLQPRPTRWRHGRRSVELRAMRSKSHE